METNEKKAEDAFEEIGKDFFASSWEESWTYIKTVVDVVREPVLVLDKNLRVMAANENFYRTFQVEAKDTEKKNVYELGDGQWNIPSLRRLLENILPKNSFFKGFEVIHDFPIIGRKVMILNARQIHAKFSKEKAEREMFPPIILLAMEDITEMMAVAETLAGHANQSDAKFFAQAQNLQDQIGRLEKEVNKLKEKQ